MTKFSKNGVLEPAETLWHRPTARGTRFPHRPARGDRRLTSWPAQFADICLRGHSKILDHEGFCCFPFFSYKKQTRSGKQSCGNESRDRQLYNGTGPSFKLPIGVENGWFENPVMTVNFGDYETNIDNYLKLNCNCVVFTLKCSRYCSFSVTDHDFQTNRSRNLLGV